MRSRDLLLHCVSSLSMVNQKFIRFIVLDNITRFFFSSTTILVYGIFDLVEGIKIISNILSFSFFQVTKTYGVPGLKKSMEFFGLYGGPTRSPLLPLKESQEAELRDIFKLFGGYQA